MDIEKLQILAKLGLLEAFQAYEEGCQEYESYYWQEDEYAEDDFFKSDIEDED
jgi:hypothetical protein